MAASTQESRKTTACAAVTSTQKGELEWLALTIKEPAGVSGLLWRMSVAAALDLAAELRQRVGDVDVAEKVS